MSWPNSFLMRALPKEVRRNTYSTAATKLRRTVRISTAIHTYPSIIDRDYSVPVSIARITRCSWHVPRCEDSIYVVNVAFSVSVHIAKHPHAATGQFTDFPWSEW